MPTAESDRQAKRYALTWLGLVLVASHLAINTGRLSFLAIAGCVDAVLLNAIAGAYRSSTVDLTVAMVVAPAFIVRYVLVANPAGWPFASVAVLSAGANLGVVVLGRWLMRLQSRLR